MQQVQPISGFPEWLPAERLLEQEVLDSLRRQFELFGFSPIETRAVEPLEVLLAKGETDKEIYVVSRLQDPDGEARYGLHYDLTVPLARYVAENQARLQFPVPPLPDSEGVARRETAAGQVPRVLPGRHRRGRARGGAAGGRRGDDHAAA
jgi:hypothetical protein